ncbi:mu-protocadherin [Allorhodopirellula solitaria]|uniref:Mu-protocadherin n=1 Tax=Allorhodopirellula solitaria TaxID=2527987 RepID=A0A5C5YEE2_9BACT|nr:mu-protocadherin [Allorhodopirellula solitaria]TWT73193.1 hypothetical protein CA85_16600 [Allorhodopirellula solitaria]
MSGAVMLLMAATVGITYGWTPDDRDGVKYIIQIPPDKMEQVARTGEISSQIPAEIRSHVSEVVIRVGEGSVPRITPEYLSSRSASAPSSFAASDPDQIPVPIPSMGNPTELRPIGATGSTTTAMMKPAPQSGGMNMPGGYGMTPASSGGNASQPSTLPPSTSPPSTTYSGTGYGNTNPSGTGYNSASLEQAARDAANQFNSATDASRQQIQQNIQNAAKRMENSTNAQVQAAANGVQDAANRAIYGPALPPNTGGSSANGPPPSSYGSNPNPTNTYSSTTGSGSPPGYGTPPSLTSSQPSTSSTNANPYSASGPPSTSPAQDPDWYALQNNSGSRPSTSPVGGAGGAFAGGNFARLPAGLQAPPTSVATSSNPSGGQSPSPYASDTTQTASSGNGLDYDPNLSPAQAAQLPKNGYSYDAEGYPVDREGYRVDHYGRRIDRQGQLITAEDSIGAPPSPIGSPPQASRQSMANLGSSMGRPNLGSSMGPNLGSSIGQAGRNTGKAGRNIGNMGGNLGGNLGQAGGKGIVNHPADRNSSSGSSLVRPPLDLPAAGGRGRDGFASDSDSRLAGLDGRNGGDNLLPANAGRNDRLSDLTDDSSRASAADRFARDRDDDNQASGRGGASKIERPAEQVAAQPIFNALLLLSVVANVYLLFWLKNLRVQFRDMVAAKRASASGSLATGV